MQKRLETIVQILDSKQAEEIQIFDMDDKDYFVSKVVIATIVNERHALSLLDELKEKLKAKNETFLNVESSPDWVVIDLADILIHLLTSEYRSRYNIEEFLEKRNTQINKFN